MKLYRYTWFLLLVIQAGIVVYFMSDTQQYGLYNSDAFSYHVQWTKVAQTGNPFAEAIVADPGHDLVRVPFAWPHYIMGTTARLLGPEVTYLVWCCLGVLATYFSLMFFAKALGFSTKYANLAALIHYTFVHILSQLPPLSGNQLSFIIDCFLLQPENFQHFGPRQYPHDIFFYPLLYGVLGLTLFGIKKIKSNAEVKPFHIGLWLGLCLLLPFNYFYHWFQFAFALGGIFVLGFLLKWWKFDVLKRYRLVTLAFCSVLVAWLAVVLFQNNQLADAEGYRFALMGGLTEARFLLLPPGLLIRVALWIIVALVALRFSENAVLLVVFLVSSLVLMNMQLVVGKNIQPGHWSFGIDRVYAWIAILVVAKGVRRLRPYWVPGIVRIAVLSSLLFFTLQTLVSWQYFEKLSRWSTQRAEVISFLKEQPPASVLAPELWLETDILIHTPHYSFLPRGAQSALSADEHLQRLTHAAQVLGYSREGFLEWLHIRSVRFFGMLYATEKEFSSTYFYMPDKRNEVLDFRKGLLPSWDWQVVNNYLQSDSILNKKLDLIVLHSEESDPALAGEVVFKNAEYIVYRAMPLSTKVWGIAMPSPEKGYNTHKTR